MIYGQISFTANLDRAPKAGDARNRKNAKIAGSNNLDVKGYLFYPVNPVDPVQVLRSKLYGSRTELVMFL